MLNSQKSSPCNPLVDRAVREIVKEDSRYALHEMRSVHRENLVIPVTLVLKNGEKKYTHSRNISGAGICLIGKELIAEGLVTDMELYRLSGQPTRILAEARWCRKFGHEYFMSGWKFIGLSKKS